MGPGPKKHFAIYFDPKVDSGVKHLACQNGKGPVIFLTRQREGLAVSL